MNSAKRCNDRSKTPDDRSPCDLILFAPLPITFVLQAPR